MAKKRFTTEQIVAILREAEKAPTNEEVLRKHSISEQTFYRWKKMYGNLGTAEVQRIKQLERENQQLKQHAGDQALAIQILQEHIKKKGVLIEEQREMVGEFREKIPSERRACQAFQVNRTSLRYHPRNGNPANELIRKEILELAKRHRRYGTPRMTWLLQKRGHRINHKRVERLYALESLQLPRKRARKKYVPTGWCRPYEATRPNEIWAMDFVYDRTKHGGQLKFLTVIDEGCRQCLEIRVEKRMTGRDVLETLDELMQEHGRPEYVRSDNGSEFINRELRKWLYDHGVQPVFIEPGSPWQNGYIESFNGKLRDECLNQEIFLSPVEAQVVVDWWRQVYNWERPHRSLKGQTPAEARLAWSARN